MRKRCVAAAVVSGIAWLAAHAAPAAAQAPREFAKGPPDLFNPQIEVEYAPPTSAQLLALYERLKTEKPLEAFRQFLAPLKFKSGQTLVLRLAECGGKYARYRRGGPVTVCYEFVEEVERLAPTARVQLIQTEDRPPVRPDSGMVGPFVQAMLHEVAIAAFDLFEVPVLGRKDDAADRAAALIMLQFSKFNMAWTALVGTAWFMSGNALATPDLSDVRGLMAQRYYTTLCIAFGGDRKAFGGFVADLRPWGGRRREAAAGDLPAARAAGCPDEYDTVLRGFQATIAPHLDLGLVKRVQDVAWLD
jgi:hypothetical protein